MRVAHFLRKRGRLAALGGILLLVMAVSLLIANGGQAGSIPPTSQVADSTPTPGPRYRILHIMSYHADWAWNVEQLSGFQQALHGLDVEYTVFEMDTKRNSSAESKEKAGQQARDLIDTLQPDLVYLNDDDAQAYVARYYVNSDIPFVFSAVNADPSEYGFVGSANVAGVLEREHFVQSVQLLKAIVPEVKTVAVVVDDSPMWEPVLARMKAQLTRLPDVEFTRWDVIRTFAEYQQKVQEYQSTVDAIGLIGIFGFKDEKGVNVPYQDVLRWTAENSRLPDFTFWGDRVLYGTLATVTVSGYEQGLAAGRIARGILVDGRSPASYPMQSSVKGEPVVSLARAKRLGIRVDSEILLTAKVIDQFEWEK
jgi:ABC-type uncharacterized transport system substrate-binding protein